MSGSYYDIPMLKASLWKWEVPAYFFAGGVSGASFVYSRAAGKFGGSSLAPVRSAAMYLSAAALAPCPALLILDLGDPRRFHHMLRVFKPSSPMSVGSWTLISFSGAVGAGLLSERLGAKNPITRALSLPLDLAGIPLALLMTAYTGVLISTTSTPIWTQNPWLGPLFSASAFEGAAAALAFYLEASKRANRKITAAMHPLGMITRMSVAVTLTGYLISAGGFARPLTRGRYSLHLCAGAVGAGMLAPTLLDLAARRSRRQRATRMTASALTLAGAFLLKWSIGFAGQISGADPQAARESTRPRG